MDPPLEGAVGGADEADNDSSYAKVKDLENGSNGNHPYATVQDKKVKVEFESVPVPPKKNYM